MERKINRSGDRDLRKVWDGMDVVVHTEVTPETSQTGPAPEIVLRGIESTIQQHGLSIGRTLFENMFPNAKDLFDRHYTVEPLPAAELG